MDGLGGPKLGCLRAVKCISGHFRLVSPLPPSVMTSVVFAVMGDVGNIRDIYVGSIDCVDGVAYHGVNDGLNVTPSSPWESRYPSESSFHSSLCSLRRAVRDDTIDCKWSGHGDNNQTLSAQIRRVYRRFLRKIP